MICLPRWPIRGTNARTILVRQLTCSRCRGFTPPPPYFRHGSRKGVQGETSSQWTGLELVSRINFRHFSLLCTLAGGRARMPESSKEVVVSKTAGDWARINFRQNLTFVGNRARMGESSNKLVVSKTAGTCDADRDRIAREVPQRAFRKRLKTSRVTCFCTGGECTIDVESRCVPAEECVVGALRWLSGTARCPNSGSPRTPLTSTPQGQILSQSPTDATRLWWYFYGS